MRILDKIGMCASYKCLLNVFFARKEVENGNNN